MAHRTGFPDSRLFEHSILNLIPIISSHLKFLVCLKIQGYHKFKKNLVFSQQLFRFPVEKKIKLNPVHDCELKELNKINSGSDKTIY